MQGALNKSKLADSDVVLGVSIVESPDLLLHITYIYIMCVCVFVCAGFVSLSPGSIPGRRH